MEKAPSLVFLCIQSIKTQLLRGCDNPIPDVYELPPHLFGDLIAQLPALALQNLQTDMPFKSWDDYELTDDCLKSGRKRGRNEKFHRAWKKLFKLRWPELVDSAKSGDWQQIYWERHLQNCLDEAAEAALRPLFSGRIGCINISDNILRYICHEDHANFRNCDCTELSFHFMKFGSYARCLRLLNVFCNTETCELMRACKLQSLVIRWIRSEEHVEPLCKLLTQNLETLNSLELIHCKLSPSVMNAICTSLLEKDMHTNGMQHFSIKTSSLEMDPVSFPSAFISFLKSGRSLLSLKFCDSLLDGHFARTVFSVLLDSSSNLSSLDLSENNISGWLSTFNWRSAADSLLAERSLRSLHVLSLRGNDLNKSDAENLAHALVHMPNLETLDLSDNPIEDDGIRSLISYFTNHPEYPLANLNLENCELSCDGVIDLLDSLSLLEKPLKSLSIADNALGSGVADAIGDFLASPIQSLNISGMGLGSIGFLELQRKIVKELMMLLNINISKNRGGLEAARFLSKLIPLAPKLLSADTSYNLMPSESLSLLCTSLKSTKVFVQTVCVR
ncbi:PREDICTED: protein NLRC3 isoform X2 [Tarenaya hassleriana]|uniref:protein NLRC3 isoform X2 n=1 Tax=Tarenaya hassleriana TaxID=28532 RepID=UPI00053C3674|nr:PREDICTED: protein NLRC3 isoform X2 [Tarenaya hassleriana]